MTCLGKKSHELSKCIVHIAGGIHQPVTGGTTYVLVCTKELEELARATVRRREQLIEEINETTGTTALQ